MFYNQTPSSAEVTVIKWLCIPAILLFIYMLNTSEKECQMKCERSGYTNSEYRFFGTDHREAFPKRCHCLNKKR